MKIYDVTVPISKELIVYPGDPPIKIKRAKTLGKNDAEYNLTTFSFGAHTGTHIDAPFHLFADGAKADELPLEMLIGPARVVEITSPRIDEEALQEFDLMADVRLLFKTRNSYLWGKNEFVQEYVYITLDAARYLIKEGVKLIGIDYLSIEKFGSNDLPVHKEFLSAGTIIVEGLNLRDIEPGDYEMICLPLKVTESDGAPARVILRQS
ncbi:MAG: cyclase family protein [Acidobacteriota bacterium]